MRKTAHNLRPKLKTNVFARITELQPVGPEDFSTTLSDQPSKAALAYHHLAGFLL